MPMARLIPYAPEPSEHDARGATVDTPSGRGVRNVASRAAAGAASPTRSVGDLATTPPGTSIGPVVSRRTVDFKRR